MKALEQVVRNANPKFFLNGKEEVLLGFGGLFGFHKLTSLQLLSPILDT